MKKIVSLILVCALTALCLGVFASAEGEVTAEGYFFHVDGINGTHVGEDNYIAISQDALANANVKWAVCIQLRYVEGTTFQAVADAFKPTGAVPDITLGTGDIVFSVHSSTSDTTQADQYPNVNDKLAAMAVTAGMYFTFNGITVEQVLAGEFPDNVTVTCSSEKPAEGEPAVSEEPSSEPEASEPAASEEPASEDTASEKPAQTADNGIVALAVIAALAVAGAVIVKKTR